MPTASSFVIAIYHRVTLLEDLMLMPLRLLIIQYYRVMIIGYFHDENEFSISLRYEWIFFRSITCFLGKCDFFISFEVP